MTFLPVVERELRVTARSPRLYWGRFFAALLAVGLVAWFWLTYGAATNSAARAKQIFGSLAVFTFGYCLVMGLFLTADSISEEKREGTLGLLFLTDLKGYDVAFGKLAATSLRALYSLFAVFPVLTIPLLLGGLAGAEVFRMALVLVVTLIFSLAIGLLISTVSKHDRKAQLGAFTLMVLITGGIPALLAFLRHEYKIPVNEALYTVSPGYAFGRAFNNSYVSKETYFWSSLAAIHGLSWLALIISARVVRGVWQDRPESGGQFRRKFRTWKRGAPAFRKRFREALLNINPYYWLTARDRLKPYYVLWFLGACAAVWVLLWLYNGKDMLEQEAFFTCAVFLHTAIKIWVAAEAGRQFFEDRRSSALELTLSTPLPVRDILEGQFLGLLRQFGIPIAAILAFDLLGMITAARMRFGSDSEQILSWIAMMIVFVVDVATIGAFGMWLGLTARRVSRAIVQTLFFVICVPWLILFALLTYMSLVSFSRLDSVNFFIGAYFIVSLVVDLILFLRAGGNLATQFRAVATQRFETRK